MRIHIQFQRAFLALMALTPALPAQGESPRTAAYIETTGYGERRIAPDRATALINVTTKAMSAAAAAAENARVQGRVMDTVRALGLGGAATTASFNVGPNYEEAPVPRSGPRQSGYAARASIRVRLSDLKEVGRLIDAALARGATGVDGVFFEASTEHEARRAATADAATAARADAEALARSLGGTLGPIISASTSFTGDPRRIMAARGAVNGWVGGASTEITPSDIVVTAATIVRWSFISAR